MSIGLFQSVDRSGVPPEEKRVGLPVKSFTQRHTLRVPLTRRDRRKPLPHVHISN